MANRIKDVYLIHHSHTDIGYTDLQERIIDNQVDFIRTTLNLMQKPENQDFRWNCETLYCVEQFFEEATEAQKADFLRLAKAGKIGMSANYLNFNDLLDSDVYKNRLAQWEKILPIKTAMFADINGISMGCRDAMLDNGVEFLYTNIHTHHGMFPLYKNQTAYFWENAQGKRLLVWSSEHYALGNYLGITDNGSLNKLHLGMVGDMELPEDRIDALALKLNRYCQRLEENGNPYDFTVASISGYFTDNAPPEIEILRTVEQYNSRYPDGVRLHMVSLQELYAAIGPKLQDAPVYRGDLTDWWANGVGSTPYGVKHYRDAQHMYRLCRRLDPAMEEKYPALAKTAQDNMMLYAEHTWGHSSTVSNPYDTMVVNLDLRKHSYASKAHEASARILNKIAMEKGDILRYHHSTGTIRVCNPGKFSGKVPVSFFIEDWSLQTCEVERPDGATIQCQSSPDPRGRKISFVDSFGPEEERIYTYRKLPDPVFQPQNCQFHAGVDGVRDIVGSDDPVTWTLPYGYENEFFHLSFKQGKGITSFVDKRTGKEMLGQGVAPIFTPIYQHTPTRPGVNERGQLGRNIRGQHAETFIGRLEYVTYEERGPVFTKLRLRYTLPGTTHADVVLRFFNEIPRVDFSLELGKTLSLDVESVFMPLSLDFAGSQLYLRKGTEAFRPGVDQIPGTCMEFYMSDYGMAYVAPQGGAMIQFQDAPLVSMGDMDYHPIRLCENNPADNGRPVYSWIMNNNWETNFKADLSGCCEFQYTLWLTDAKDGDAAMDELQERSFVPSVFIIR